MSAERWAPPVDLDALYPALIAYHAGTDRGELRALLVEVWGPSPMVKPECTGFTASWCPIHGDCKCPYIHGIADNGRTMSDPGCPLHAEGSRHGDDERLAGMASDLRGLAARESAPVLPPPFLAAPPPPGSMSNTTTAPFTRAALEQAIATRRAKLDDACTDPGCDCHGPP